MDSSKASEKPSYRKLTETLRIQLKGPFGKLIKESELLANMPKYNGKLIISVGDITTLMLLKHNIEPDIAIVDFICKRKPITNKQRRKIENFKAQILKVNNPQGQITSDLILAIEKSLMISKTEKVKIYVEGEEDLAVIPCAMRSPKEAIIIYGQPDEGVVLLKLDENWKKKAEEYYSEMEEL